MRVGWGRLQPRGRLRPGEPAPGQGGDEEPDARPKLGSSGPDGRVPDEGPGETMPGLYARVGALLPPPDPENSYRWLNELRQVDAASVISSPFK